MAFVPPSDAVVQSGPKSTGFTPPKDAVVKSTGFVPPKDSVAKTDDSDTSPIKTFLEHTAASVVPGAGALATGAVGAEAGFAVGGPVGAFVGGLGGAIAGGYLTGKAQESVLPEAWNEELAASAEAHPYVALSGSIAGSLPTMGVGRASKAFRAVMGGIGGGLEYAREKLAGEDIDYGKLAISAAGGAALTKPTKLGKAIAPGFERVESKMAAAAVAKTEEARKSTRLVSTGFKDETTGKTFKSGPYHPEEIKNKTNYTQGFITDTDQFVDRHEAEKIARANGQIPKDHELEHPTEGLHSGDLRTAGDEKFKLTLEKSNDREWKADDPLAVTDKEGKILLNDKAIENDFHNDFSYIFDATTPTGKQKAIVFKKLGITKEDFKALIKTPEDYRNFLKAHEESHVNNNDRETYPRNTEGKIALEHPKALEIEARATKDGLDYVKENPYKGSSHTFEALDQYKGSKPWQVVFDMMNRMRHAERLAGLFRHEIETAVPEIEVRKRMTMAAEGERFYDALKTDKEREITLYGHGRGGKQIELGVDRTTGEMRYSSEKGLVGALEGMRDNLSKGKVSKNFEKKWNASGNDPKDIEGLLKAYEDSANHLEDTIKRLQEAPSEEHAIPVLEQIQQHLSDMGKRAQQHGLLDALREHYIPHMIDFKEANLSDAEQKSLLDALFKQTNEFKFKSSKDFTLPRQYEFIRTLDKVLEDWKTNSPPEVRARMEKVRVERDVAVLIDAYDKSMITSMLHKGMIDHFTSTKTSDGKLYMVPASEKALSEGYVPFQGRGAKALEGQLVHPELVDILGHAFRHTDPAMLIKALGGVSHLVKSANTIGSLFHAYSLLTAHAVNSPASAFKELFTGMAGSRAAFRAFTQGDNATMEPLIQLALKNGLMVGTEDIQRSIIAKTGDTIARVSGISGISKVTNAFDRFALQKINTFTWDYMHTGQKLHLFMTEFGKMQAKNPGMSEEAIAKTLSEHINRSFGGLNWIQVANRSENQYVRGLMNKALNIGGREWAQVLMFAPDWTLSTLKSFTDAVPKELSKPQNWKFREGVKGVFNPKTSEDFARRYVLHTAIGYFTILNAVNYAQSGHFIWENKDPTRIDLGDGTSMQAAKHSMEFAEWVTNPEKTFGNKLGFIPKAVTIATTGVAYPSPDAPKLKDNTALGRLQAIALSAAPFQISAAAQAPTGEGLRRALYSFFGLPVYGHKKDEYLDNEERVNKRIERRKKLLKNRQEKIKKLEKESE